MSFEYKCTRDDLKKELTDRRFKSNIIFLVIAILLYLFVMWNGIRSEAFDNVKIFIYFLLYLAGVMLVIFVSSKIYVASALKKNDKNTGKAYGTYHVELTDETISVTINDQVISYKYKDIYKKKKNKNSFFINTKEDKIGLLFTKDLLDDNFDKLVNYVESRL